MRTIAIVLPQFHPIPENDAWWGPGFTEWSNVVKCRPRFSGHYQPHLPADLGFYDLRLPETRAKQAHLAATYGITGFCYYHYWFHGRRLLQRPVEEIFALGEPQFPFMLCWANENWTRAWDGGSSQTLVEQTYSDEDYLAHIEHLIPFFCDARYITNDGRPVFVVYKDAELPNPKRMCGIFRDVAKVHGLELYLCRFERQLGTRPGSPQDHGFDAGIEFQPLSLAYVEYRKRECRGLGRLKRLARRSARYSPKLARAVLPSKLLDDHIDYAAYVDFDCSRPCPPYVLHPGVCPGWDNSARRDTSLATIFRGNSPEVFSHWVEQKVAQAKKRDQRGGFLFVNAWNEWAEGNHLEPDTVYGHRYLAALKNGLEAADKQCRTNHVANP